jgi:hypothetical protein
MWSLIAVLRGFGDMTDASRGQSYEDFICAGGSVAPTGGVN